MQVKSTRHRLLENNYTLDIVIVADNTSEKKRKTESGNTDKHDNVFTDDYVQLNGLHTVNR